MIPDSIDPYIGYKWLKVSSGGQLWSINGGLWPEKQPFEARCTLDWGYYWTVAPAGEEWAVRKTFENSYKNGSYVKEPRWVTEYDHRNWVTLEEKPPKKPKLLLPPGLLYSYEARPCPHQPVAKECSCGIYAAATVKGAASYERQGAILIKVAIWGRTIIGDNGARGQFAYPQEIIAATKDGRKHLRHVGERYGILSPIDPPASPEPEPQPTLPALEEEPQAIELGKKTNLFWSFRRT